VKSTFLNGAYAPADQARPLPVLLSVNEGFTGPNGARVPLAGCLALGKAAADLGSERATIQLATLSCVLPSGAVFERDVSGYVVGNDGTFGVQGTLVRRDAAKIGMATLTGFLAGAGQALSRAESTVIVSPTTGATTSAVTGNTARFAALAGLSETANQLSRYYLDLARQITPAIQVPSGVDVHLVMHRGVTIEGLHADDLQGQPLRYATRRG
jgi:conjugal transfer pilus assembly protein TraB